MFIPHLSKKKEKEYVIIYGWFNKNWKLMVKLKQVTKVKIKHNISWISQHRSLIKFGVKLFV